LIDDLTSQELSMMKRSFVPSSAPGLPLTKRRAFFLAIAAALLVSGVGARDARAGFVPLPATLDKLTPSGNFTTVAGAETLTFSNFTFSSSSLPPGFAPASSSINVVPFAFGPETGFSLNGTLSAPAGTLVDVEVSYLVTAPKGELISDAVLITAGGPLNGGNGTYAVNETLTNPSTFAPVAALSATPGSPSDFVSFPPGLNSILVTKDIFLSGGTGGVSLSVITQAFSSTGVPEPGSMALLGIGMTGFLAFRRLFKRGGSGA
jgi:hypothetical protein